MYLNLCTEKYSYMWVFDIFFLQTKELRSPQFFHSKYAFEKIRIIPNIGSQKLFYVVYNSNFAQMISG